MLVPRWIYTALHSTPGRTRSTPGLGLVLCHPWDMQNISFSRRLVTGPPACALSIFFFSREICMHVAFTVTRHSKRIQTLSLCVDALRVPQNFGLPSG